MPSSNIVLHFASTALAMASVVSCGGDLTDRPADDAAVAGDAPEAIGESAHPPRPADASRIPLSHRASAMGCPARPAGTPCRPPTDIDGGVAACTSDGDCTDGVNGRCNCGYGAFDAGVTFNRCVYADSCESDDDCRGQVCSCGGYAPDMRVASLVGGYVCVAGNCRTDDDCGKGGYCSPSLSACSYITEFACHTADDECVNDSDCAPLPSQGACTYSDRAGHWVCSAVLLCTDGGV